MGMTKVTDYDENVKKQTKLTQYKYMEATVHYSNSFG